MQTATPAWAMATASIPPLRAAIGSATASAANQTTCSERFEREDPSATRKS